MSSKAFGGAIPGEDEYLELSDFLGQQRTKYDELRTTYREKQKILKDLQGECEHLERITELNDTSTDVFRDKSMKLNKQLEEIRTRTEDGQFRTSTYRHMLGRLEGDRLLLDKQLERLQHLKKEAEREHHHVKQMMHNQKQRRNQLEKKRRELADRIRVSKAKREKRLEEARDALKEQVRMQTRRESREKKRRQIALEVAGDLGEEEEERLKKQYVTKQMYSTFLAGKLEKNVERSSALQEGFQKIKNATGLSEVEDILQKYLTRDETYASLQAAAKEAGEQIERALSEQKELQSSLESIQLQGVAGQGNRTMYREIDQFDSELAEARKMCTEYKERSMRASMTLEDVRQCVVKLSRKLDLPMDTKELPAPEMLPSILSTIETKVRDVVDGLATFTVTMERKKMLRAKEAAARLGSMELAISTENGGGGGGGGGGDSERKESPSDYSTGGGESVSSFESIESKIAVGMKARDMLYNSLMAVEPDTSTRNIRVPSKKARRNRDTRGNVSVSSARALSKKNDGGKIDLSTIGRKGKDRNTSSMTDKNGKVGGGSSSGSGGGGGGGNGGDGEDDNTDDAVVDRQRIKEFGRMMVQANDQRRRRAEAKAVAAAVAEESGKAPRKRNVVPGSQNSKKGPSASEKKRLEMLLGKDQAGRLNDGEHFKSSAVRQPRPPSGSTKGSGRKRGRGRS